MATKRATGKQQAKKAAVKRGMVGGAKRVSSPQSGTPRSMPKGGRDPQGGLTAKGREFFHKKEGSHLRPGVLGKADTPEKMVRKGSFLRRHFANPRGPMMDEKGQPTRLALSAHAWGEPVPKTMADARKLANKGHALLEKYHSVQEGKKAGANKTAAKKASAKKVSAKKVSAKQKSAKKTSLKKTSLKKTSVKGSAARVGAKKTVAKKSVVKKTRAKRAR